ncbi:flavocytochrome c [Truncatella angustata]|uniref:Fumarate reductase n=1 Tax=Truncatella angustata TaxID=152316 RepID=A0A9P8UH11_9PEZI|nr:flavocytochrome c [Truncatella angustata]KAH6652031.1 flavocytochrome c [Truncatella angustata]
MTESQSQPVIVVGSGLAGLSAAYEALKAGASVRMLDRAPKPGGNSIKASSGINGAGTAFQRAAGVEKDDLFYDDTVRSAGRRFTDPKRKDDLVDRETLVKKLTGESASAVQWLVDEFEIDLSVVATLGGHSVSRTHRGVKGTPGFSIVSAILKKLGESEKFQLTNGAEVLSLTRNTDSAVTGVRYAHEGQTQDLEGAVVFAAGGFAGDATGLLAEHRPDLAGLPSTNDDRPASHHILGEINAAFVDMDSVQIHPTGFVDPKEPEARYKFLAAEALRGEGGILLDHEGTRFVDELGTRAHVSAAIMALARQISETSTTQWDVTLLLDPGACEAAKGHLGFYTFKGLMEKKKIKDLDPVIIETVDKYASAVASGSDSEYGRKSFGHWTLKPGEENREQEVCVGKVTPITHFTMGGAAFNQDTQVLRKDKTPIAGLWAAGEITGGIHGDNRLGGSSLLECVVYGRIAGSHAAKAALRK